MPPTAQRDVLPYSLARFVDGVRLVVPTAGRPVPIHCLPDGRIALVFRTLRGIPSGDVAIVGPQSRALFKRPVRLQRALMLHLKPGWSQSLLGVHAQALTDQVVTLEHLWGTEGPRLASQLTVASSLSEALQRIAEAIAARPPKLPESSAARLARRAARMLEVDALRVEEVAQQLGVSARHLRRAFSESIGVSPKVFARGARLRRAVQLAANTPDWSRVAVAAGYWDQSHLIGDFQRLTGLSPTALLQQLPTPLPPNDTETNDQWAQKGS